jgi:hypothetical protein
MSKKQHTIVYENVGVRVTERPSKDCDGHFEYHVYALDTDDFGAETWRWVGKSGVNEFAERYAQRSRN